MKRIITLVILLFTFLFLNLPQTQAATITVTRTTEAPTNGIACSLRNAVRSMNAGSDTAGCSHSGTYGTNDKIVLTNGATYTLSKSNSTPENLSLSGDLDINTTLKISAPLTGDPAIIEQTVNDRVFHVVNGSPTLENIIIQGGNINDTSGYSNSYVGAGIYHEPVSRLLTLSNVTIRNNEISSTTNQILNTGGAGVFSTGNLTMKNSIIESNFNRNAGTQDSFGALAVLGISNPQETFILNSTISNNEDMEDPYAGIFARNSNVTIYFSTISDNKSAGTQNDPRTAFYIDQSSSISIGSSIVKDNASGQYSAADGYVDTSTSSTFTSLGNNFFTSVSTQNNGFDTNSSLNDLESASCAGLPNPADNGGLTNTVLINSVTQTCLGRSNTCDYNDGTNVVTLTTDQRGTQRDVSGEGKCDKGAFELNTFYQDNDGDTYGDDSTATTTYDEYYVTVGGDCNDNSSSVHPGVLSETCDGVDNDCDGTIDENAIDASTWYVDSDGDGYGKISTTYSSCNQPAGYVANSTDCNDAVSAINPGATEMCDGVDNNCDGTTDEDTASDVSTWYADFDLDGYGNPSASTRDCSQPAAFVANSTDCDDNDNLINPAATETCDGVDNDCDGATDETGATGETTWYADLDRDGYGAANPKKRACNQPAFYVANTTDCDNTNASIYPGAAEACDGKDNNCDGTIDDGVQNTYYADSDADGYTSANTTQACSLPSGHASQPSAQTDCNDNNAAINQGATETCDSLDNDCDGATDEAGATGGSTWYRDSDSDDYGDASNTLQACSRPAGYSSDTGDCNDADAAIAPSAAEICGDTVDENCDGSLEGQTWYIDTDNDGYGTSASTTVSCTKPVGYVTLNTDCNDSNANVNPNASEICDGLDNNCNGATDDNATNVATWYLDTDNDGYGIPSSTTISCSQPGGYASNSTDCDDAVASINPGVTEICDGIDNDCDGSTDESGNMYYQDFDGDGYGDLSDLGSPACTGAANFVADNTDCADGDAAVNPGATEVCSNNIDDNCDGQIDTETWYVDNDADGYGDTSNPLVQCGQPSGYVTESGDCDDGDNERYPSRLEYCSDLGVDNNCNSNTDDADDKLLWYLDADGDGYGDENASDSYETSCSQPAGYANNYTDCDDTNATAHENCGASTTGDGSTTGGTTGDTTGGSTTGDSDTTGDTGTTGSENKASGNGSNSGCQLVKTSSANAQTNLLVFALMALLPMARLRKIRF